MNKCKICGNPHRKTEDDKKYGALTPLDYCPECWKKAINDALKRDFKELYEQM